MRIPKEVLDKDELQYLKAQGLQVKEAKEDYVVPAKALEEILTFHESSDDLDRVLSARRRIIVLELSSKIMDFLKQVKTLQDKMIVTGLMIQLTELDDSLAARLLSRYRRVVK